MLIENEAEAKETLVALGIHPRWISENWETIVSLATTCCDFFEVTELLLDAFELDVEDRIFVV